ncbi:uncharacterized protein LOC126832679 [Patella vulgata]|uniref:uncharacterized protein LOC126832679 n=1 Tax=Patella vulgata TaxID=6465 RepID=UPI0024A9B70E|nr:uncharacterized protein LOC126832679 [Patella vulgata]
MESGKSFGEVALISEDSTRNASVIVDTDCDFLVVGRKLFNRSLKAYEESKYEMTKTFIRSHPYFTNWSPRFKRLLELSLRREVFPFESTIVKQGDRVKGVFFIVKGQANVTVEPGRHRQQYHQLWPFEAGVDTYSIEFEWLRESRKNAILRRYENPAVIPTKPDHVTIRRKEGCGAVEKKRQEKSICLCTLSDGEIIGDTELSMNLKTYMQTVVCTADTEVFMLDLKTYDRLVGRKNLGTVAKMKAHVVDKLETRLTLVAGDQIPLLRYLHYKLTETSLPSAKKLPPLKASKSLPATDVQFQYLLERFREGRAPLVLPHVPGALYYKDLMEEKARIRENVRRRTTLSLAEKVRETRRAINRRKPRSRREICESLREMAEAELIMYEQPGHSKNPDLILETYRSTDNLTEANAVNTSRSSLMPPTAQQMDIMDTSTTHVKDTRLLPITEVAKVQNQNQNITETINQNIESKSEPAPFVTTMQKPIETEAPPSTNLLQPPGVDKSETQSRPTSKWETPRQFVKEQIQAKYTSLNNLDQDESFDDFETSDTTLSYLESRIRSFHIRYGDKPKMSLKLPKLKRFKLDLQDDGHIKPRPGGRVWMHRKHCRFAESKIQVKGHEHVRHHMVSSLPEFTSIKQTQMVVNVMMSGRNGDQD